MRTCGREVVCLWAWIQFSRLHSLRVGPHPPALARRLRASLGPQALASREKILLQSRTFSRVSDHRVIRDGCALDGKKCLEGFGPTPRLDGFFRAAEIVVRWSKPPICGHV